MDQQKRRPARRPLRIVHDRPANVNLLLHEARRMRFLYHAGLTVPVVVDVQGYGHRHSRDDERNRDSNDHADLPFPACFPHGISFRATACRTQLGSRAVTVFSLIARGAPKRDP